jgi:hypothetical protein
MSLSDQRAISRLAHNTRREELLEELSAAGPQAVYGALLGYAHTRNYKTGWCAHAFREIFGAWPRPQDRCGEAEPLPGFLIEEWVALSPRKSPPLKTDKPTYERIVREEGRRSWLTCKSSTFMDDEAIKSAISRIPLSWRRDEVLKSLHSADSKPSTPPCCTMRELNATARALPIGRVRSSRKSLVLSRQIIALSSRYRTF